MNKKNLILLITLIYIIESTGACYALRPKAAVKTNAIMEEIIQASAEKAKGLNSEHADKPIKIAIVTPRSLKNYGDILKDGFNSLKLNNVQIDMLMPEAEEVIGDFAKSARNKNYDVCIVQLHGAHTEELVAFEDFGVETKIILLVHRPEEVIERRASYRADGKDLDELFESADRIILLGNAMADNQNYTRYGEDKIAVVEHGYFFEPGISPLDIEQDKDLSIACIGSATTWSDMRWAEDVKGLMNEVRMRSGGVSAFGYIAAGKFVGYEDPYTQRTIDPFKNLEGDPDCIVLSAQEVEDAYRQNGWQSAEEFKRWLFEEKSEHGKKLVVLKERFSIPELDLWRSFIIDFDTQMYRELLNKFKPKVEYSGTLHRNPGTSIFVVFDSPSMRDVENEGLRMIKVKFNIDKGSLDFETAAQEIIGYINDQQNYNNTRRQNLRNAIRLLMSEIALKYLILSDGLILPDSSAESHPANPKIREVIKAAA